MTTLISFLGKGQKTNNGYAETTYQLNQGAQFTSKFMGAGLVSALRPKKFVLIGTASSMWDSFFDHVSRQDDDNITQLMDAVDKKQVDEALLHKLTPTLEEKLGCSVHCIVIDFARDSQEQVALLNRIADELNDNDHIILDITHAFRHLPMLAMIASRFLKQIKNITTDHIYYGAFDMKANDITPIIDLNGLLTMLDWVDALAAYQKSDNYAVFSPLLDKQPAQLLQEAAFFENINQVHNARSPLTKFRQQLNQNQINNPFVDLVKDDLKQRTVWAEGSGQYEHQLNLAKRNLANGDYWQAAIRANEAWISKMVKSDGKDQSNYHDREAAQEHFKSYAQQKDKVLFQDLAAIRNAMAHGTKANRKGMTEYLSNEAKLKNKLSEILQHIEKWKY